MWSPVNISREPIEAVSNAFDRFGGNTGKKQFLMDDVQCQGSEDALQLCQFGGWGTSNCVIDMEAAGIICSPPSTDPGSNPGNQELQSS